MYDKLVYLLIVALLCVSITHGDALLYSELLCNYTYIDTINGVIAMRNH